MEWADKVRTLKVRTNADTPKDAAKAREFGAEGIGLCRTEHMFFGDQRIVAMRKMILADDESRPQGRPGRARAVPARGLRRHLRGDGRPARDDPPARPAARTSSCRTTTQGQAEVAKQLGIAAEKVSDRVEQLHESNPMLGLRGCRLAIVYPEIGDMQVRAIIDAAIEVKKQGKRSCPRS